MGVLGDIEPAHGDDQDRADDSVQVAAQDESAARRGVPAAGTDRRSLAGATDLDARQRAAVRAFVRLGRERRLGRAPRNNGRTGPAWFEVVIAPGDGANRRSTGRARAAAVPTSSAGGEIQVRPGPPDEPSFAPVDVRPRRLAWLERRLPDLVALTVATGALVAPWTWLFVVTIGCAAAALAGGWLAAGAGGAQGAARLGAMSRRGLARSVRLLRPRSLLWVPVLLARILIVAVLLSGMISAARWLAEHGTEGLVAAFRSGAWAYGFRVAAVLICAVLITGAGEARDRRADWVLRRTIRLTDGALLGLVVGSVATAAAVVLVPRVDGEWLSGADGLAWAPAGFRDDLDLVRDDIVTAELDTLAACLSARQPASWETHYTGGNPPGDEDVAHLIVAGDGTEGVGAEDLVTATLAAHNQLAPWVEIIEVSAGDTGRIAVDRGDLPRTEPLTDPDQLAGAVRHGGYLVALGASDADPQVVVRCSAGPVL